MNWSRYYEETDVLPFKFQAPYYAYLLESLTTFVEEGKTNPLTVALGGLHPKVTSPDDFIHLCRLVFTKPLDVYIIDQNERALSPFPPAPDRTFLLARLENLPFFLSPLSLLICDFTLDFMTDAQLSELNNTLPDIMDSNGLLVLAHDEPIVPTLARLQQKMKFGIDVHPRRTQQLSKLLPRLKCIYEALTDRHINISIFAQQASPLSEHTGTPYSLDPRDNDNFANWLGAHGILL